MKLAAGILCLFLLPSFLPTLAGAEKTVAQLIKQAEQAEKAGHLTQAYLLFAEAAAKDPTNVKLWARAKSLEGSAVSAKTAAGPPEEPSPSTDSAFLGKITEQDLEEAKKLAPPPQIQAKPGLKNLDLRGDSRAIFEAAAREFGLRVLFDPAYQPKTNQHIELNGVNYRDAFRGLEAATDSFAVPLSHDLLFIANDTPQKRAEFDPTATVVIPVPEPFSIQEIQQLATAVRGALDIQRVMIDSQRRLVLVRDRASKTLLAEKIIRDLMRPKPQVAIEVQMLDVSKTSALDFGLSLPSSFGLAWFGKHPANITASTPPGFTNFLGFGKGRGLFGIGIANAGLFATVSKSSATTLLDSVLVTADGEAANLHVGDKFPIPTNVYIGSSNGGGQAFTPPPAITFEDLGLVLKIVPHVNGMDEISLDVDADFKVLGGSSVDGVPVISDRSYQSKVGLKTGELAILAGLTASSDSKMATGIPGLMFPFLRHDQRNKNREETLIVLKPSLVIQPPSEFAGQAAWTGTETKPRTEL